ncbi:MAG: hypothetical protein HLUCCA01_06870 [Bacteroidetes bacterium HLUCCA01]|nr:MAG: hypothetical protein HLUCCA01_06870 [Bacteroidetes bacterium HLUCCA01]
MKPRPMRTPLKLITLLIAFFFSTLSTPSAQTATDYDEVFFEYRYMQLVATNIVGIYQNDAFFLPFAELFDPLLIYHETDWDNLRITGYINTDASSFALDFTAMTWQYRDRSGTFTADDFIVGQFDIYLSPAIYQEIFEFEFRVDLGLLSVRLFTSERVPILVRQERQRLRARIQSQTNSREIYQPQIGRQPKLFNGGFLDYNLNANTQDFENYSATGSFTGGVEILHGDVQGSVSMRQSQGGFDEAVFSNVRWRYYRPKGFVRQIYVGDVAPRGNLVRQRTRGVSVTNEPLYPTRVIDEFNLVEMASPDSEVEVFINDRLFDFFTVDETGQYNVRLPITYGINDIRVVVYAPDGQVSELNRRLNIPFYFAPPDEYFYTATVGRSVATNLQPEGYWLGVLTTSYGINLNHTLRLRAEYQEGPQEESLIVAEHSARWLRDVITNIQVAPTKYEQFNVTYQSLNSNFFNGYFNNYRGTYRTINNNLDFQYGFSGFVNLPNRFIPLFVRAGVDNSEYTDLSLRSYNANVTTRFRTLSVSGGFRSLQRIVAGQTLSQNRYTLTTSYSTPRTTDVWAPLRGIFFRNLIEWRQNLGSMERVEFSASRRILSTGQLQVSYTRFVPNNQNALFISLSFDIPSARFNTSVRSSGGSQVINQAVRGSIGYFHDDHIFVFDNRQQVGRAALVANNFVDNDGSGRFSPGDELLGNNAIRLVGAGTRSFYKKDRAIFTQLRQYDAYNVEVNEALVRDPSLTAVREKFSIVTDPNQFKVIDVAFVRTGIIDGMVTRMLRDQPEGVSGLTMRLENLETGQVDAIRTFFDGSFYKMEVRPGRYRLQPDSTQLALLNVTAEPAYREVSIVATEFGDFVEGLDFELRSAEPEVIVLPEPEPEPQSFRIQTAVMNTLPRIIMAHYLAEQATGLLFEFQYSPETETYRLFSSELTSQEQVDEILHILHTRTDFDDAFVITDEEYDSFELMFAVQIGAQNTRSLAEAHAQLARDRYGLQVQVVEDLRDSMYKIQTVPSQQWRDVCERLERILQETEFADAFVVVPSHVKPDEYLFIVQVGAYARESMANRMRDDFVRRTGLPFEVTFNRCVGLYTVSVRDIPRWGNAIQMYNELLNEYGFEQVLVVSRRK